MSIHEEVTRAAVTVLMPVFNNLVLFDQHKERNTIDTIVPDLAESWAWSEDGKELTFKLRRGVKWHDGKPFTAADVKCTWDLLQGKTQEKLRLNPRKAWYRTLDEVTTKGDDEVTFHLKRSQPYFLVLLAPASRRSIPATSRRRRCGSTRSAPARSNSSNISRTNTSN
jgi:peptide/nickel transport system substrate-binding protein